MANSEKIDEIISESAFQQIEKLSKLLVNAQGNLVSVAADAKKLNDILSNAKTINDYSKAQEDLSKKTKEVSDAQEVLTKKNEEYKKQVEATVASAKAKITTTAEEAKVLDLLTGSIDQNIRRQIELKKELKAVQEQQKELTKAAAGSAASKAALTEKTAQLSRQEIELKTAIQQNNLEIKRSVKENLAAEGSSDALSARLDKLRATYRGLSEEERNNQNVGGILLKQIIEYDTKLKELDANQGVYNRNVGNYTSALTNLKDSFLDLIPGAQGANEAFQSGLGIFQSLKTIILEYIAGTSTATASTAGLSTAQSAAVISSNVLSGALKILRIALISTGIGAIVVALGSLIAFLVTTQEGIDAVTSVTRPLVAIFQSLLGAAQKLGKSLFDAFSNPKQLLQDLLDFLTGQVVNRIKAFGKIFDAILNRDFNAVNKGIFDLVTGVENATDKIQKVANATGKFLSDAAKKGSEIDRLQKEIEKSQLSFNRNQIKTNDLVDEQLLISKDTSRSFAEREKASRTIIALRKAEGKEEAEIIKKKIQVLKIQQSLNDTGRQGQQELIDLQFQLDAAQDRGLDAEKEQIRVIAGAKKEAAEQRKRQQEEEAERQRALTASSLALEQQRLKTSIDRNSKVVTDEKLAYEDRLSNLDQQISNEKKLVESQLKSELNAKGLLENDKIRLQENANNEIAKLSQKQADLLLEIVLSELNEEQKARLEANKIAISDLESKRDKELLLNEESNLSLEDKEKKGLEIIKRFNLLVIQEQIKQVEKEIELSDLSESERADAEARLAALKIKFSKEATDAKLKDLALISEKEAALAEFIVGLSQETTALISDIGNASFERKLEQLDLESQKIQQQSDFEREQVNDSVLSANDKQIKLAQIDAREQARQQQIEDKKRQIQLKQARFQKAITIANIIQQTALAVISAAAQVPKVDFGVSAGILASIYAAVGAAQLAVAIATPIPGFFKGTDYSPKGLAYVGEQGAEGRINPDGTFEMTPPTKTLTYLEEGTKIISNPVMKSILGKPQELNYRDSSSLDSAMIVSALDKTASRTEKAVKSIPINNLNITKGGWRKTQNTNNGWNEYLNKNF